MRLHSLAALCFALSILLLFSCSKDNPTESTNGNAPLALTVNPVSGPPLTSVTISGIDPNKTNLEEYYVLFDGVPSGLISDSIGTVISTVPAIVDSATGWTVSGEMLSIAIVNAATDDTLAFGADLFTVTDLPAAPGTTAEVISNLSSIHQSIKSLTDALYPTPNVELGITGGFLFALDSIANGVDSLSLPFMLADMQANDPDGLALYDALLASSGMAEQTTEYASIISAMADSGITLVKQRTARNAAATVLTDEELAWQMQFYVVLKQFGNTVIKPTASTYSKIHGLIGIAIKIPLSSLVSAALSIIDFTINKLVVALLPAKIDDMTLELDADTISMGEQTTNTITVYASNDPPPITWLDMTKWVLTSLGLDGAGASARLTQREFKTFLEFLERITLYVLKLFRSELAAFKSRNPDVVLDFNLGSLPKMTWEAEIEQKKFVELKTFTQTIIEGDAGEPRWVSLGPDWGEGRVYAATTVDPGAIVIPQPPGFQYSGGAFGEDVEKTETKSVWVKPGLVLELTMPQSVDEVNFEPVKIVAGYEIVVPGSNPASHSAAVTKDTIWSANIDLDLNAGGGSIQHVSGVTDANGEFNTGVKLSPGSGQVTVTVDGEGDVGSEATVQGNAVGQVSDPIIVKALYGASSFPRAMPAPFSTIHRSRVTLESAPSIPVAGVPVTWSASGAQITAVDSVSKSDGLSSFDISMNLDSDSTFVYATANAGSANVAYDTAVVYSYCLPDQASSYTASGDGSYTAIGSPLGCNLNITAPVGGSSGAAVSTEDRISVIAADSSLWNENCIVYLNISYSWSVSGGVGAGFYGIQAEVSSPGQFPHVFLRVRNLGQDDSGSDTIEAPVRGIKLAPWGQTTILGRYRVDARPDPDVTDNTAISNFLMVEVTGVSKVTLMDGTPVEVLCLKTGGGLTF